MYPTSASRIMEFLLRNITEEFNVNQLAKRLSISVGGAHQTLKNLLKRGILSQRILGNAIYYRLNLENEEARKLCELVLIESKNTALSSNPYAKIYAADLEKASKISKAIVLFGSLLTKGEKARDVDALFLVERKNIKLIENLCIGLSRLRTKTINPLLMTTTDFRKNISKKDSVITGILRDGIVVTGENVIVDSLRGL